MELSERIPQVRVDSQTMARLQERVAGSTGNLSDHVRRAIELYVAGSAEKVELEDETMLALQWAAVEMGVAQGRPLLSLDAMVKGLISHWNATKHTEERGNVAMGILPSGILELGYS